MSVRAHPLCSPDPHPHLPLGRVCPPVGGLECMPDTLQPVLVPGWARSAAQVPTLVVAATCVFGRAHAGTQCFPLSFAVLLTVL